MVGELEKADLALGSAHALLLLVNKGVRDALRLRQGRMTYYRRKMLVDRLEKVVIPDIESMSAQMEIAMRIIDEELKARGIVLSHS